MTAAGSNHALPVRVCLLIRQLNLGGAQRQLLALARGLDPERYQVTILTFYPGGIFSDGLVPSENIDVRCLYKRGRWEGLCFYLRAGLLLRQLRPDILYSFMGGANLLAVACRPWLPGTKVFWGVRGSGLEWHRYQWPERLTAKLEATLSRFTQAIICNSQAGMAAAAARGLQESRLRFIPNGIDGAVFLPIASVRETRSHWGAGEDETVLGLIGRADPMKGHETGFHALKILRERGLRVRLQLIGYGAVTGEASLRQRADELGVGEWCGWEPLRHDMPAVYSALDLLVSSSAFGEGFPNVVAEAMACGTPCVATAVGDAALLIGDLGEVVPPRDPVALADGIQRLLQRLERRPELRHEVRASILARYSIEGMVEQTALMFGAATSVATDRRGDCASLT